MILGKTDGCSYEGNPETDDGNIEENVSFQFAEWIMRPFQGPTHDSGDKGKQRNEQADSKLGTIMESIKDNVIIQAGPSLLRQGRNAAVT